MRTALTQGDGIATPSVKKTVPSMLPVIACCLASDILQETPSLTQFGNSWDLGSTCGLALSCTCIHSLCRRPVLPRMSEAQEPPVIPIPSSQLPTPNPTPHHTDHTPHHTPYPTLPYPTLPYPTLGPVETVAFLELTVAIGPGK